ncbi:MAG TPA: hypothetical protein VID47_05855 [Actinomycetota bacterium]
MRSRIRSALILAVAAIVVAAIAPGTAPVANASKPTVATADPMAILRASANELGMGDPDLPPVGHEIDPATYLRLRSHQEDLYRGAPFTLPYNARLTAIRRLEHQRADRGKGGAGPAWTALGPDPIPNGQTNPTRPVSGRVTAIAVDPADPNDVYVGTAQGGLYRSRDGGSTWTAMMDDAATLAIGSLAFAPSDPSVLYVGTGEGNLSGDSYAGVGLYRFDDANGASPTMHGPFETRIAGTGTGVGNGHAFSFLAIQGIAVDPANADRVFVSATPGGIGMANDWVCCTTPSADPGLYLTTNGTATTPQFSKVAGGLPQSNAGTGFFPASTDVKFMPGSSTTLLVGIEDIGFDTSASNGIWRTTTATAGTPAFTHITLSTDVFNTRIATGPGNTALVGAETDTVGKAFVSTNGGATFPTTASTGDFCRGQCWYDVAPAIDPSNAQRMLLGGSADSGGANILQRSTNGGSSFSSSDGGLHADSHATAYAQSNPSIVYAGDDGGIFKSTDGGATWSSLNTSGFSATQFQSIAVHPTDPNFTIGGTQDNGTPFLRPNGTWTRADFGDGGFAAIDQTATGTTHVTMYHTYFNQTNNLIGFGRVTTTANAHDGSWNFFGCGGTGNGIACGDDPLFYAPLVLGPKAPDSNGHDTVYFGTNRLYRSANQGSSMSVVSQNFGGGTSGRISDIAISPQNDKVRIVGLSGGGLFGTTTGATSLRNLDPAKVIPNAYVARAVVDPSHPNTAYVSINGFLGGTNAADSHVWRTTNLDANPPTWHAINNGLPDVPANAMVIDPVDPTHLYLGTDIGVYASTNSGGSWTPFGTGLPIVAIFDMAIARPGTGSEVLRVATHGRGMYQATIGTGGDLTKPTAAMTAPAKTVTISKSITLKWKASDNAGGSGLANVDLRVKSARFNAGFGAFTQPAALQHLTGTSRLFTGTAGTSYCFAVRARDHAGNLSGFSAQKCTMVPVDDRAMAVGAGSWTRKSAQAGAFLGTLSTTSAHNATLKLNGVHARQLGVLVKRCSTCGTFSMTFAGHTVTANTKGSGFVVVTIPAFPSVKTGNLVVKVTSTGKPVQIDGVAAPQTGAVTTAGVHLVR